MKKLTLRIVLALMSSSIHTRTKFSIFALIILTSVNVLAQKTDVDRVRDSEVSAKRTAIATQRREASQLILNKARLNDSEVLVILEFPQSVLPWAVDPSSAPGEIVAVYMSSFTSDWNGITHATKSRPIRNVFEAVQRYTDNHRTANPNEDSSTFGVDALAIRTRASSVDQWLNTLRDAQLVYVRDLSEENVPGEQTQSPAGTSVYLQGENSSTQKPTGSMLEQSSSVQSTATSSGNFLPTTATLTIEAPSLGRRMINGSFSWSSDDALAGLRSPLATLEIQTLFWNHGGAKEPKATYVGEVLDFGISWKYAYYDVNFLDDQGKQGDPRKRSYTVGSWNAAASFKSNVTYTFWIATKAGDLSANLAEFSAQKGTYIPVNTPAGDACLLKPAMCVWPIGSTDWFSPTISAYGKGATQFSIVAPTIFPFTYPKQVCAIPPGQPALSITLDKLSRSDGVTLGMQMSTIQQAFKKAGGKPQIGCATTQLHEDELFWPRGGKIQDFNGGAHGKGALMLAPGSGQAYWLHGGIWNRYVSLGGPKSLMGEPTGDEQAITSSRKTKGAYQAFERGWLYYNGLKNRVFYVVNAIAQKYKSLGLHSDQLGLPTSDEYAFQGGARNDFEGGYIHWTPAKGTVVVRTGASGPLKPTIESYSLKKTPRGNEPFDGTMKATGLVQNSTKLWFCLSGTKNCYPHPQNGITVKSSVLLEFKNVRLSSGVWEMFLETPGGQSAHSKSFVVLLSPPMISGFKWSTTPKANKNFSGYVEGTEFVPKKTEVLFCIRGKRTCYPHPMNGITVVSATRVNVKNVRLSKDKWQVVLRTPAGQSGRSSSFTVK
jgi:hypothetical protein